MRRKNKMIKGKKLSKTQINIVKSILSEMVNDDELYAGGIPNESQMIDRYGFTQNQCAKIETKIIEAVRMMSNYLNQK